METSLSKSCAGKPAVFITGSGKCGTSVVAHSFFAAGFPMGSLDDLHIFEGHGNVRGLWEHRKVLELNCEILKYNSCDWHTPHHDELKVSEDTLERMRFLADSVPAGFCCKDPRLVTTFSAWSRVFDPITVVGCFRNPGGFAKSIVNVWPDKFTSSPEDTAKALDLWSLYNTRLLSYADRVPVHWVDFDESLPNLKSRIASVMTRLGRTFNEGAFEEFFIPAERRFSAEAQQRGGSEVPAHIMNLYDRLIQAYRASSGQETTKVE